MSIVARPGKRNARDTILSLLVLTLILGASLAAANSDINCSVTIPLPDTSPPLLIITQPVNGKVVSVNTITVSGTATDPSGILSVTLNGVPLSLAPDGSFNTSVTLATGANLITVVARDNSPSTNTATVTRTVTYTPPLVPDTTPPNLIVTHPLDGQTFASNEITVTGFVVDESGIYAVTVNGGPVTVALDDYFSLRLPLNLGSNTITVTAVDASELRNTATVTTNVTYTPPLVSDTTAPALTVYQPPQNATFAYNEILVSGTTADESGIRTVTINGDAVALAPDGSFSTSYIITEGANTLSIVATDDSPNRNTKTVVRTVTYAPPSVPDTTPPTLVVNEPQQNAVFNRNEITVSGTVWDEGGLPTVTVNGDEIAVALDGSFRTPVILTAGANTISVRASDSSDNTETITRSVTYNPPPVPDTIPPILQVTQPLDGQVVALNITTVMGTATDASGIRSLTVNGVEAPMIEDRFSAEVRLLEGVNTITVRTIDLSTAMNRQEVVLTVTYSPPVDHDPPTLSLSQPEEGLQIIALSNRTEVSGTVADVSGIYSLAVNGVPVMVTDKLFTTSVQLLEGQNLITVIATDNSTARNQRTVTRNVTYSLALGPPGPPQNLSLTANPPALVADGEDAADITARVIDANGTAVADGTEVAFSTTNGFLYSSRAAVNGSGSAAITALTQNGTATVILVAPLSPGTATVTATAGAANGSLDLPFSATASISSEYLDTTVLITHSPSMVVQNCSMLVSGGILKLYTTTAIAVGILDGTIVGVGLGSGGSTLDFTVRKPIIKGGLALCELELITLNTTEVNALFASRDALGSEVDINLVPTCLLSGKHFLLTQHRSLGDAIIVAGGADAGLTSEDALNAQLLQAILEEFGKTNYHSPLVITATLDGAADEEILTVPIKLTVSDRWFAASANGSTEHIRLIETNLTTGLVEEILPVIYWVRLPNQTITLYFEADDFSTFALIAQPPAAAIGPPSGGGGLTNMSNMLSIPLAYAGVTLLDFEWLGLDIISLALDLKETVVDLKTTLAELQKPTGVPEPPGSLYAFYKITSSCPADRLERCTVNFRVNQAWLRENSIATDQIKLYQYEEGQGWQTLPTQQVGEDDRSIYYTAETTSFSFFAITGWQSVAENPPATVPTVPQTLLPTAPPGGGAPQPTPAPWLPSMTGLFVLALVTLAIAAAAVYVLHTRRKI
jgi:PGF-pre-PGF domain-containing protein